MQARSIMFIRVRDRGENFMHTNWALSKHVRTHPFKYYFDTYTWTTVPERKVETTTPIRMRMNYGTIKESRRCAWRSTRTCTCKSPCSKGWSGCTSLPLAGTRIGGYVFFLKKQLRRPTFLRCGLSNFFGEKKIVIRGTTRINTRKELKVFRPSPFVRLGRGIRCVGSMI
jgi:hypothetical protein